MPGYIAIILCIYILAFTGALNGPGAAIGMGLKEICYILLCVLALSVFQLRIGVEVSVNLGAAALTLMPGFMMKKHEESPAGIGAPVLIAAAAALMKHNGSLYGGDSGLLTGLMAGASSFIYRDCPAAAVCAAAGIPIIAGVLETVINLLLCGYAAVEIGHQTIAAQLIALGICTAVIWVESLQPVRAGTE